ncbi:hypothetical protein D3C76_1508290 [compost metagenome]
MNVPNGPDNGFYLSADPMMVMETNSHLRGYMPGLICPFSSPLDWHRKNFAGLPALPAKIVRFILLGYANNQNPASQVCLMGFDLTGPWR